MGNALAPILYLPHGGGPLPVLGDPGHAKIIDFLKTMGPKLGQPSAILVVSAHWEATSPRIMNADTPGMLYDYSGFPPEAYEISYPAPGQPDLALQIQAQLSRAGISADLDESRGYDHGLFIPLKLMFPEAQIPCLQISLIKGLDPTRHIEMGRALNFLRAQNVLIVGSGMSFHNMQAFFRGLPESRPDRQFDDWLTRVCCSPELSQPERDHELINWEQAPFARYCHPREEHLLPLHVCYGAAGVDARPAKQVFNDDVLGTKVSAFLWV
jgi:aromatic ring-opening dioxygenase catalytic subunit (LigB family)